MSLTKYVHSAPEAWKVLNGLVCLYKPLNTSLKFAAIILKNKLCEDLNSMKTRPPQTIVEIRRLLPGQESAGKEVGKKVVNTIHDGSGERIEIIKGFSYADHPAVIGPRYIKEDMKHLWADQLSAKVSGVVLLGLNKGTTTANKIHHSRWIRTFIVSGRFGIGTDTHFYDGKILEKTTYHTIRKHMIDRILCSLQSSQQRLMFESAGVSMSSERAYELASKGLIRPESSKSSPVIYSLKCLSYDPPNFDIEIKVVNDTADYLAEFVHDLGLKLHAVACCTKIRCIQHGPFTVQHALLQKHWTIKPVIQAMLDNSKILKDFDLNRRDPLIKVSGNDDTTDYYENEDLQQEIIANQYTHNVNARLYTTEDEAHDTNIMNTNTNSQYSNNKNN